MSLAFFFELQHGRSEYNTTEEKNNNTPTVLQVIQYSTVCQTNSKKTEFDVLNYSNGNVLTYLRASEIESLQVKESTILYGSLRIMFQKKESTYCKYLRTYT